MHVFGIDASLGSGAACWMDEDRLLFEHTVRLPRGHPAALPGIVATVQAGAGLPLSALGLIAVGIGPGSFTGLRSAIALARGLAAGLGCPVVGVTQGEAALAVVGPEIAGRQLWMALDGRGDSVLLERDGTAARVPLTALPAPAGPVAVAGEAAIAVAARLAAAGHDVKLLDVRAPSIAGLARAGLRRVRSGAPARPVEPLYAEPPAALPPRGGLREPPAALQAEARSA
ncbi:MAG: tRNA (adenosine(37)-N6)-threonylcarbamoyltransferase complex dimerization subunit type 1 TsaB [Rhodospirillales bacterium]|nr:tRNA (adenosine(37)-N6)-threonylcarbamoyltransferase complex dimerization subunit type 1 TsaB [Rhodospirillales bacterium]